METVYILTALWVTLKPIRGFASKLVTSVDARRRRRALAESVELSAWEHWVEVMRDNNYRSAFTRRATAWHDGY